MHLHPDAVGVCYHRHIAGNDGRDARRLGCLHQLVHLFYLVIVDNRVHRQVSTHSVLLCYPGYAFQIFHREIGRRTRTHIQVPHTEIHGVGTRLYGGTEALVAPHWSHNLNMLLRHRSTGFLVHRFHSSDCLYTLGIPVCNTRLQSYDFFFN